MIILDVSANTHKNSMAYVKRMIDELVKVDSRKHEVVIKHQLFTAAGDNIPLQLSVFDYAYWYAEQQGYQTTASVFDLDSLKYLLCYDVPFVKIANRSDLYWLAGEVPRKIPVYASFPNLESFFRREPAWMTEPMWCVSKYPADIDDYDKVLLTDDGAPILSAFSAISDHTTDFKLWYKYQPEIIEWHYKLADSTGLDSGLFARTPEQLKEIL